MHEDDIKVASLMRGGKKCLPGQTLRKGHVATRKTKTLLGRLLKRGTTYRVKPHCVGDALVVATTKKATAPKIAKIGPLKQGSLTDLGYSSSEWASTRRAALAKAVGKYGRLSTFRKLNAITTLMKNTSPSKSAIFKADRDWVKKTYF
jgi:hypothetical protein